MVWRKKSVVLIAPGRRFSQSRIGHILQRKGKADMRALEHMSTAIWVWVGVKDYRMCKYVRTEGVIIAQSLVNRRAEHEKETNTEGRIWFMGSSSWKLF